MQLKYLEQRVAAMDMAIEFRDEAVTELAKAGFDPVYGARPRAIRIPRTEVPIVRQPRHHAAHRVRRGRRGRL